MLAADIDLQIRQFSAIAVIVSMQQIFEFIGNHPLLMLGFAAVLGMLVYTEYLRFFSGIPNLSPYAATQLLNEGDALFLDVREEKEYKSGHIKGARSLPVNEVDKQIHDIEKYKERDVVVYCESGMRASKVTSKLKKSGFTKVSTIAGGLVQWEKANLPLVNK